MSEIKFENEWQKKKCFTCLCVAKADKVLKKFENPLKSLPKWSMRAVHAHNSSSMGPTVDSVSF